MKLVWLLPCLWLFPGFLRGAAEPPAKLQVLTSILPVYCLAASAAGSLAQVDYLLAGTIEAHDFQFTPRERRLLDAADLVIINGLNMEPWLETAMKRGDRSKPVVIALAGTESEWIPGQAGTVKVNEPSSSTRSSLRPNPHLWLDPLLALRMLTNVCQALAKADPVNASGYVANTAAAAERLLNLHREMERALQPHRGTPIVTQHNAFPYFARRYGLRIVGVIEPVPGVSPTLRELAALRQAMIREKVRVIFSEAQHPAKLIRQLVRDLKIAEAPLDTLETGKASPQAYEEGMRRNLRALLASLP